MFYSVSQQCTPARREMFTKSAKSTAANMSGALMQLITCQSFDVLEVTADTFVPSTRTVSISRYLITAF